MLQILKSKKVNSLYYRGNNQNLNSSKHRHKQNTSVAYTLQSLTMGQTWGDTANLYRNPFPVIHNPAFSRTVAVDSPGLLNHPIVLSYRA
jgi:hypothetical protein